MSEKQLGPTCQECSLSRKICIKLSVLGLDRKHINPCKLHPDYAHLIKINGYDPMEYDNAKEAGVKFKAY